LSKRSIPEDRRVTIFDPAALVKVADPFGPSNDHELAIARVVDQFAASGKLDASVTDLLVSVLPFTLTPGDGKFLVEYVRWRMDHPIVK
jgi:hypothetical protein